MPDTPAPMTADERRRLAVVETRVCNMVEDIDEIKGDVKSVLSLANQAKGGGKVALWAAGIGGGTFGAAVVKFLLPALR